MKLIPRHRLEVRKAADKATSRARQSQQPILARFHGTCVMVDPRDELEVVQAFLKSGINRSRAAKPLVVQL